MVARTIILPNLRKLFIPDPGNMIAEVDLAGAEAQVVAWDAGDEDLKSAFRAGLSVHIKNARDVFPAKVKGWSDEAIKATDHPGGVYYTCKRCVHATHNGGKPKGLAAQIGITVKEATEFQNNWFGLHPRIKARQNHIMKCLQGLIEGNPPRTILNQFGFRKVYFDEIDQIFTKALTWVQQSTVAINRGLGAKLIYDNFPWIILNLDVHDALVFQYKIENHTPENLLKLHNALHSIFVPYSDPLCIPWKLTTSSKSWGDAEKTPWGNMSAG